MGILKKSITFVAQNIIYMKKILAFVTFAIICGFQSVMAVPAHKGAVKITQPDGTTVTIRLHGDEYLNFNTTADGYSIVKNNQGYYVYAELRNGQLQPTTRVAHDVAERSAEELTYLSGVKKYQAPEMTQFAKDEKAKELNRRSTARQKAMNRAARYDYSNFRGLIILVEFSDRSFSRSDYASIVNDFANSENYTGFSSSYPFTGSVRDYFKDNSGGLFEPQFDVVGPVKVNRSQYYSKGTQNASQVVYDAVTAADSKVNFKDYDRDNDGMVDMVYFIFAGYGSNYSGNDSRFIWPHAGIVYNPQNYGWVRKDGVALYRYACSTELYGLTSMPEKIIEGIGTICHEFSHVLGLPDFYDTDYEENGGESHHPGEWDIMAAGSYNNYSRTPVGYTLFERYAIGFATPEVIDALGQYTLQNVSNNVGYRINTPRSKEYFLLENRQKDKWNQYGPGHGMLVFRVDSTNSDVWNSNQVNVNPSHNYFELLRAGGGKSGDSDSDPFPGTKKVRKLNNETSPANLKTWAGKNTPWGLENIKETNGVITFDVVDVNVLNSVTLQDSVDINVGFTYPMAVECYPESAPCTLEWTSDNETVATVDENGVVTGKSEGVANIIVKANGNDMLTDTCKVRVNSIPELHSIMSFNNIACDQAGILCLSNAEVVYVHGSDVYLRDSTSSLVLTANPWGLNAGDEINGRLLGKKGLKGEMPLFIPVEIDGMASNISVSSNNVILPVVLDLGEVTDAYLANYITLSGYQIKTNMRGVSFATDGTVSFRIYNSFGLANVTIPAGGTGTKYDFTGILTVRDNQGTMYKELGLLSTPVETGTNSIFSTSLVDQRVDIYTIDGRRVENMSKSGIYIVRQGQEIRKVFVK